MRTALFSLMFLWTAMQVSAQCCPYINSVQIIPSNPSVSDTVRVVMNVTTPSQGSFLGATHVLNGNQINLQACYYSGMLPALQTYIDTVVIGLLANGTYSLNFTARQSADHLVCSPVDSTQFGLNFSVSGGSQPSPPPCCLQIVNLDLLPSASIPDSVNAYVRAEVQLPAVGNIHAHSIQFVGDSIFVQACYLTDSVSSTQTYIDTFSLGLLNASNYTLKFIATQGLSSLGNCSSPVSADTSFATLEVTTTVSTQRFETTAIRIFPNPIESWFAIENYVGTFELYDVIGNCVLKSEIRRPNQRIDISNLSSGIYLLNFSQQVKKIKKL